MISKLYFIHCDYPNCQLRYAGTTNKKETKVLANNSGWYIGIHPSGKDFCPICKKKDLSHVNK